jgi:hypothetical protein
MFGTTDLITLRINGQVFHYFIASYEGSINTSFLLLMGCCVQSQNWIHCGQLAVTYTRSELLDKILHCKYCERVISLIKGC